MLIKNHEVNTQRDDQLQENRLSVCKTGVRKFRLFFRATVSSNSRKLTLSINWTFLIYKNNLRTKSVSLRFIYFMSVVF